MTTTLNKGLLAPSDIADLAGVSRAAVSNWRKRVADFGYMMRMTTIEARVLEAV